MQMMTIKRCEVDYVVLRTSTSPRVTPCRQQAGGNCMSEATSGRVKPASRRSGPGGRRVPGEQLRVVRDDVRVRIGTASSTVPGFFDDSWGTSAAGQLHRVRPVA